MFSADDEDEKAADGSSVGGVGDVFDDEGSSCRCSPDVRSRQGDDSPDEGLPDGSTFADFCRGEVDKRDPMSDGRLAAETHSRANSNPFGARKLTRDPGPRGARGQNAMNSQESLFAQYASLDLFPNALRVCSAFHAGPGQQTFGASHRQKADALLVDPSPDGYVTLRYLNLHGLYYHAAEDGVLLHMPGCPRDAEAKTSWKYRGQAEDDLKSRLADCMTAAAAVVGLKLIFSYK